MTSTISELAFDDYQRFTRKTAIYPEAGECSAQAIGYCALGIAGEAGEVANKAKKLLRDGDTNALREQIIDECGDLIWYWARILDELGRWSGSVADSNMHKLNSRLQRGVLHGSGENR